MSNKSVGWQFFEDGLWWTGFDTNNHRKNTEEAGIPVRDIYADDNLLQARIEDLEQALEHILSSFKSVLGGKCVRDVDETISHIEKLLRSK